MPNTHGVYRSMHGSSCRQMLFESPISRTLVIWQRVHLSLCIIPPSLKDYDQLHSLPIILPGWGLAGGPLAC